MNKENDNYFPDQEIEKLIEVSSLFNDDQTPSKIEDQDHMNKFDIPKSKMEQANAKMVSIGEKTGKGEEVEEKQEPVRFFSNPKEKIIEQTLERRPELKRVGNVLVHKKTEEQYNSMWKYFSENALRHFEKIMGYGESEIRSIGIEKFIDAFDWTETSQIDRWEDDNLRVIPCCHCGKEFSIFQDFGLCENCKLLYDLPLLEAVVDSTAKSIVNDNPEMTASSKSGMSIQQIALFVYDEDFRKRFLK